MAVFVNIYTQRSVASNDRCLSHSPLTYIRALKMALKDSCHIEIGFFRKLQNRKQLICICRIGI